MIDCDCDVCIGREDIDGERVCPYTKRKPRGGITKELNWNGDNGPEVVIPIPEKRLSLNKDILSIGKEVVDLSNRINEDYGNQQDKS